MSGIIRKCTAVAVAVAAVLSLGACQTRDAEAPTTGRAEPIRIGAVLSLTGTYAALGRAEKQALQLEVERVNAAGGVNGVPIEVLIEDDGTDEAKAVAAAEKLIDQDKVVAIIGASGTGQTMAMRTVIQRAGVPQISLAGGTVVTAQFDPLVFQTPWSNRIVVPFVLEAIKRDGHASIALLSDSGGYGKDGRAIILKEAKRSGLKIVSDETFNPGDADLSAQLTKIKAARPDAVLIWTAGKEAAIAVKSARELGLDQPFYGGSGQAKTEFIDGAGEAAEGFVFGTGKSLVPENWGEGSQAYATVSDLAARYQKAYGEAPDIFAGHAFDALLIVVDALKRSSDATDPRAVRDAIGRTRGLVGFGGTFTFSTSDHNGLTADDLALYRIEGGAWRPVK